MATLVATEEFPFKADLKPKASIPAVITESVSSNGIKVITRDSGNSGVCLNSINLIVGSVFIFEF